MADQKCFQGFTDEATSKDYFEIDKYTDGLTKFISNCNTPMTVSIQGSWGTGKTSIMNIMKSELDKNDSIQTIWFNSWQFSQFNMENDLPSSLLSCLIEELKTSEGVKTEMKKLTSGLRMAGALSKQMALSLIDAKIGERFTGEVEHVMNQIQGKEENISPLHSITHFKTKFSQCVEDTGKDRIVVFIDDLDRLEPRKAVEILEVLKLFLDCKKCVFILAIDYDVVLQGVSSKYGQLSSNEKENMKKGRDFFDKIIQVPFKMPVASYNITNYIAQCFEDIGLTYDHVDELEVYEELIRASIGTNPRAMKRMFNGFLLLTGIVSGENGMNNAKNKQILFGTLCLQHCNEEIYNYIVRNRYKLSEKTVTKLLGNEEDMKELPNLQVSYEDLCEIQPFLRILFKLIGMSDKKEMKKNQYETFVNLLELSSVTSAAESVSTAHGGSQIVTDITQLNFRGGDIEKIQMIISLIQSAGENANTMMVNQNSGAGVIYGTIGENTKHKFVQSFGRKNGYRLEFLTKSKTDIEHADSSVTSIFNEEWKVRGNSINHTVTSNDPEELAKVKTMLEFAYGTWINKE